MSGRLGQLWERYNGLTYGEEKTLYYVIGSSKKGYLMFNFTTSECVVFKKKHLDEAKQRTWFLELHSWLPRWKRVL